VLGTDDDSMAMAANMLAKVGGGQVVIRDKQVLGLVELPIGGIISNRPAEIVAEQARSILDGFRACGCKLNNPNMTMSLLALVVIPELRLSDKGLIDVKNFKQIPLVVGPIN
jgi:adenine deaminase